MKNDIEAQVGLFVVPPKFVDRAWKDGAHNISRACDRASQEITGDQMKLLLSRGERTLAGLTVGGKTVGWAVFDVQQLPNIRVLYIYNLYAPFHSLDVHTLMQGVARENGCSVIRGAVDEANARVWKSVKAEKVYSIYQVEVKDE